MPIRLVDAGSVPYLRSQTVYHGVAWARTNGTPDTIILACPMEPYVCIGLHQEVDKEVDLNYCAQNDIPVVRREVGGGAVYLDRNQIFTQWIFHPQRLPLRVEKRFEFFADPLVATYKALGIQACFRPINDIQVNGKKIGGTGAGAIGNSEVLVGNFLFDFDFTEMAKVLKVPNEQFRGKVHQSLQQYMTTMKRELGAAPSHGMVKELYVQACERVLGDELVVGKFTDVELRAMEAFDAKFTSADWLHQKGGLQRAGVKIHNDVWVYDATRQAKGGSIQMTIRKRNNQIDDISIFPDFKLQPEHSVQALENALLGVELSSDNVRRTIEDVYRQLDIQSPGVQLNDWVQAILSINATQAQG